MTDTSQNANASEQAAPKKSKARKAVLIVFDVILYAFLALCVFALVTAAVSKKSNGAANIFGYEMRVVVSDSMEKSDYSVPVSGYKIKEIKVGSMVFIKRVPKDEAKAKEWYASLREGDVLTFAYVSATTQDIITHRIAEIVPTENGYLLRLCGDNRASADGEVSYQEIYTSPKDYPSSRDAFNYVIGKVVGQSVPLGYLVYGVSKPVGLALIVILPCLIIMIWQIARIVSVVTRDRKQKAAEQIAEASRLAEEKNEELEELRRKVAEMEKRQSGDGDDG